MIMAVNLGPAARFAVLARQGVTNTGFTTINGDLGTWPLATAPTGFPPGVVNGIIHVADPAAEDGQASLTIAGIHLHPLDHGWRSDTVW